MEEEKMEKWETRARTFVGLMYINCSCDKNICYRIVRSKLALYPNLFPSFTLCSFLVSVFLCGI